MASFLGNGSLPEGPLESICATGAFRQQKDLNQLTRLGEHDQTGPSSTNPSASWAPVAHPSMVRPLKCYVPRYAVDQIPWVPTWALRLVASDSDASSFGLELEDKKCSKLVRLKTLSLSLSLSLIVDIVDIGDII